MEDVLHVMAAVDLHQSRLAGLRSLGGWVIEATVKVPELIACSDQV